MEADWSASRGWTQARTLAAFGSEVSGRPALAVDPRGDAVIAWAVNERLLASYRPAGGAWQTPRTLSRNVAPGPVMRVAIDGRGRALAEWTEPSGSGSRLIVAARARSGVWEKPKTICLCYAVSALAMNANGLALIVWSANGGGVRAETRSPTGRWSPPQQISPTGSDVYYMPLALNSRGSAVVAWTAGQYPALTIAVRPAHGRFGQPQTIGGDAYWGWVLAIAPTGEAVIVSEDGGCCMFAMSRRPGASSFGSQQTLAPGFGQTVPEALTMDAHGNALALWARSDTPDGHLYLHAAQRPAGGSFDTGTDIGDIGLDSYKHIACPGEPSLTTAPNGRLAIAVWLARIGNAGSCKAVEAATFTR